MDSFLFDTEMLQKLTKRKTKLKTESTFLNLSFKNDLVRNLSQNMIRKILDANSFQNLSISFWKLYSFLSLENTEKKIETDISKLVSQLYFQILSKIC